MLRTFLIHFYDHGCVHWYFGLILYKIEILSYQLGINSSTPSEVLTKIVWQLHLSHWRSHIRITVISGENSEGHKQSEKQLDSFVCFMNINLHLMYDPPITVLRSYPREITTHVHTEICFLYNSTFPTCH